jgi:predicted amidohydrolase
VKAALIQLTSGDDPIANLKTVRDMVRQAAGHGATIILTPEVTNCVSTSRKKQLEVLHHEDADPILAALCADAKALGVTINIGSLAIKTDDPDGRFANRSIMIGPDGGVIARYDKIHMFDVTVCETEIYKESSGYRPGTKAIIAKTPQANIGMTICYDVRFPHLYRKLALAGADILLVPSAFSQVTGKAHWETLLRARAIETGCFVFAAAQTGTHPSTTDGVRKTYGHSLAVSPWGDVLADGGTEVGITFVDFDLSDVEEARKRIPSLSHDKVFEDPNDPIDSDLSRSSFQRTTDS